MPYLLISNVFFRKAFDVIAILQKQFDYKFIIGIPSTSRWSHLQASILYKGYKEILRIENQTVFFHDLLNISRKYAAECIIYLPIEEVTTDYFYQFCLKYGSCNFLYQLPPYPIFCLARDKRKLNMYCLAHAIHAPKLYSTLTDISESDLPLILKPKLGSGSSGIIRITTKDDLCKLQKIKDTDYVIQELLPNGRNVKGAFFLAYQGKLISAYTHERIRTSPPEGGVSVLSQASYNNDIIEEGRKLIESLNWSGLLMLEFLYDVRCRQYKIIEANPRIWGSIMLSEYCGSQMLENYVRLCCSLPLFRSTINTNVKIRWFFPVDLLNYIRSGFRINDFWYFHNTCFINWSYAAWHRAMWFNLSSIFKLKNIQRFFR
jgi:hypothetical protein